MNVYVYHIAHHIMSYCITLSITSLTIPFNAFSDRVDVATSHYTSLGTSCHIASRSTSHHLGQFPIANSRCCYIWDLRDVATYRIYETTHHCIVGTTLYVVRSPRMLKFIHHHTFAQYISHQTFGQYTSHRILSISRMLQGLGDYTLLYTIIHSRHHHTLAHHCTFAHYTSHHVCQSSGCCYRV